MNLELSFCRVGEDQLQDSALGHPVTKTSYHLVSLLLSHVFEFRQKGGTGNFGSVDLYKFSNSSKGAIQQI